MVSAQGELSDMAKMFGWLPIKAANSPSDGVPEPDMVMVKGSESIITKIVILPPGTSKKGVSDKSHELERVYNKTIPSGMGGERNARVGFSVRIGLDAEWYWVDRNKKVVYRDEDYKPMSEVF